jgi:hypothetical protein
MRIRVWDRVPEQDRATAADVREFFRPYYHRPKERADSTIAVLLNPKCHAAVSLDFTDRQKRPPYVPCKLWVWPGDKFCTVHGGSRRYKVTLRNRAAAAWHGWKNATRRKTS